MDSTQGTNFYTEIIDWEYQGPILEEMKKISNKTGAALLPARVWEYPWSVEQIDIRSGSVLDAGAGYGALQFWLANHGLQVTACDIPTVKNYSYHGMRSPEELHKKFPSRSLTFVWADMSNLSFDDNSFDAVISISVLEHLPIPKMIQAFAELWRVLKKGGPLVVTVDYGPGKGDMINTERLQHVIKESIGIEVELPPLRISDYELSKKHTRLDIDRTFLGITLRK